MKPTSKILEPYKDQIIKEVAEKGQVYGCSLAERLCGYKGYGFKEWLKEVTGDDNFGVHPRNPPSVRSNYWLIKQKLEQTFIQVVSNLEAIADKQCENEELEKEIRLLKWKVMEARRQGAPASEFNPCEMEANSMILLRAGK